MPDPVLSIIPELTMPPSKLVTLWRSNPLEWPEIVPELVMPPANVLISLN